MKNILLTVSYDGTDFCGWQKQDTKEGVKPMRTVQQEIETALHKLLKEDVKLQGSGRTDSGVHAAGQAATFLSPFDTFPCENYPKALNAFLPSDIRIVNASEKPEGFSARFSATSRSYRYFIMPKNIPFADQNRFVWTIKHEPDINLLNEMASCLKGEIDCAAFAASGDMSLSTFRYLEKAHFFYQDDMYGRKLLVFEIEANAFLWKMVRSITGSLIEFERSGKPASYFREVLESRERKMAGPTAPAQGLFLWNVSFDGIRRGPEIKN